MTFPHIEGDADFREAIAALDRLLTTKGHDYTQGGDRLKNFDRNGERLGLTPETVLAVYMFKHFDAIETYLRKGAIESEPIETRILDGIGYLLLLYKMVRRGQRSEAAYALAKVTP